ncbi:MAG: response regulator [Kofleriaceae bacterium]|nr:response regulator [Kofleriaceae bacterium]
MMIVDDCESAQFLTEIAIRKHDPAITIVRAYDGVEALQLLDDAEQLPDIIFLDIDMPRMSGHEFLVEYSKREASNAIAVVMLTSSDREDDKQKALQHGNVKSYLLKPLKVKDIRDVVTLLGEQTLETGRDRKPQEAPVPPRVTPSC